MKKPKKCFQHVHRQDFTKKYSYTDKSSLRDDFLA